MKQVLKVREDGSFDFRDMILIENDLVPDGYEFPDETKQYNSETGLPLSDAELDEIRNTPSPKNEIQLLEEKNADLNLQIIELWEILISGGVI